MPRRAEPATVPADAEPRDVASGRIYFAGGALLLALALALIALWLVFSGQSSGPAVGLARPDPAAELAGFEAREEGKLNTLAWIDRKAGTARIPVSLAMTLIAARGRLPEWPPSLPADQRCQAVASAVPRSPAAVNCMIGWRQWEKAP